MIVGNEVSRVRAVALKRSLATSGMLFLAVLLLVSYSTYAGGIAALWPVHGAQASAPLDIWWPTDGAHVSSVQPFKAMLEGTPVEQYDMYWQVGGGALNPMGNSYSGYPHKEATVDLTNWTWKGAGPYQVTVIAKQGGTVLAERSVSIYNDAAAALTLTAGPMQPAPSAPTAAAQPTQAPAQQTQSIAVWWPINNATLSGVQPFKAVIANLPLSSYTMYWQVDGGGFNLMADNTIGSPHKEASVDVSGWSWRGSGPYTVNFVAKDGSGTVIAQQAVAIMVSGSSASAPAQTTQTTTNQSTVTLSAPTVTISAPLSGFYTNPNSSAATQASAWAQSQPSNAQAMQLLANQPTASWFGGWNSNVEGDVHALVSAASAAGKVPVLVAYNIPGRDCGGYSQGGANSGSAYQSWIGSFAQGLGNSSAVVVLEPDSLAQIGCLSSSQQQERYTLLSQAVAALKQDGNARVYLDAGHAGWIDAATMAGELKQAGVAQADGFALNVSNFVATADNANYGAQVSGLIGNKHFVIDTSRNGNGSNGEWCNPSGRAIGHFPTTATGNALVDAYLWVKTPGESDGSCNGGPSAGVWWADYALGLVRNAGY